MVQPQAKNIFVNTGEPQDPPMSWDRLKMNINFALGKKEVIVQKLPQGISTIAALCYFKSAIVFQ